MGLRKVGIESVVLERTPAIREAGAGLSLWSNAVIALRELRVEQKVLAAASIVERSTTQTAKGHRISVNDFASMAREAGAHSICVHRGVLQRILLDELPPEWVRTGAHCAGFDDSTAILENGERVEGDFLIGADGISSMIRAGLFGAQSPRYAGYYCWRGIRPDNGILADRSSLLVMSSGAQFGVWPCGKGRLYWFLTKNGLAGGAHPKAEALELCRNWGAPVPEILEGTPEEAILHNDIVDRPPLRWHGRGRVVLLGDAAHATTPNLGQGGCQALEDAVTLAHCVGTIQPLDAALREYERLRIPRTLGVVRESWRSGRVLQAEQPMAVSFRNWFIGTAAGGRLGARVLRRLLTYKVPKLAPAAEAPSAEVTRS